MLGGSGRGGGGFDLPRLSLLFLLSVRKYCDCTKYNYGESCNDGGCSVSGRDVWLVDLLEPNQGNPCIESVFKFCSQLVIQWDEAVNWRLTLHGVHTSRGERSLLGIVGKQLCHPTLKIHNTLAVTFIGDLNHECPRTYAMVNGTAAPPIPEQIQSGARWEKGPKTGVAASRLNMTMATRFPKIIIGQRRPFKGPSDIQTAVREYTAVNAFESVGYSFYPRITTRSA